MPSAAVRSIFRPMKLAETTEEQRVWMQQWRAAALALEQVKRETLREMTPDEAKAASHDLLSLGPFHVSEERWSGSGLVEQQRIFRQWPSQR